MIPPIKSTRKVSLALVKERLRVNERKAQQMDFKVNKKPWESKKWMMAAIGFAVITAEVVAGLQLPDELIISQALLVLGYLGVQVVDDVKGRDDANESKKLDLLGKLPPSDPTKLG